MILHVDDDVEIARGAARAAVLAFAVDAEALPGGNARRDLRGYLPLASDATRAAAGLARLGDHLPGAPARGAGARDRQKALLETLLAAAAAGAARLGRRSCRRAGARAGLARLFAGNLDRRLGAGVGLFEQDLEVVAQIRAALRAAAATASAEHVAKAEQIPEV